MKQPIHKHDYPILIVEFFKLVDKMWGSLSLD